LLTVSLIDPILLPLASKYYWHHVSAVVMSFHHIVAQIMPRVLILGHGPILENIFI
jgi:hypothetical protein